MNNNESNALRNAFAVGDNFLNTLPEKMLINIIANLSDDSIFVLDVHTSLIQYYGNYFNTELGSNKRSIPLGYEAKEGLVHEDDTELYLKLIRNMQKGRYEELDIRYLIPNGTYEYYTSSYQPIYDKNGDLNFVIGKTININKEKMSSDEFRLDLLTGCFNKVSAEQMIASKLTEKKELKHALFILDIDNFKVINDSFGHLFGDDVLKEVAKDLKKLFRSNDVIARIGGDEFVIFLENVPNVDLLVARSTKIIDALNKHYSNGDNVYEISASIGVAQYPEAGTTYRQILKSANDALSLAKNNGKKRFVFSTDPIAHTKVMSPLRFETNDIIAGLYFDHDLISSVFNILYETGCELSSINSALRLIAQKYNADRCYILETFDEGETYHATYEWCRKNVVRKLSSHSHVDVSVLEDLFLASHNGMIYSKDFYATFRNYGDFEKSTYQGTHSFLHSQIKKETYVKFILGIDDCSLPRVWTAKEVNTLQYMSKIISLMIESSTLVSELNHLNYYDPLTHVKNRNSYRDTMQDINKFDITSLGVVYIDIKGLSSINYARGTTFGDEILVRVANLLETIFGNNVYRVGGDEFVVIVQNVSEDVFENKVQLLDGKGREEKDYKLSIGYTWNRHIETHDEQINSLSHNKYSLILTKGLESEIAEGKFVVFLQPQIDMQTDDVTSAEALIRRKYADGRIQPPIMFIPFYEKEGIISRIDLFVLDTVCKAINEWKEIRPDKEYKVSVNCSRSTITEDDIVDRFAQVCQKNGVSPSLIVIEITETINSTNNLRLSEIISNFIEAGFLVSLDDFGSGYSNLSTFVKSRFDELKIDMQLTNNLHRDEKSKVLTEVALNLCERLDGLTSVAEGIETKEQYDILKQMNCVKGQGYYFDKPMPINEFTDKYVRLS
ncbi:EAL domain-containing protein [Candidatus Epulonipiscium viviparus]|uniref:EAL domain-containing protein n=1 Tax=Candidatus Epulonipiscium viviparus TaxID=420336 RepID=UPI00016BFDAB|nr:EAL domain-containing protein [Candidatus Epulopiscium viviparus]